MKMVDTKAKYTPLLNEYQNFNPRITSFAGFHLPGSFSSVKEEYYAVRKNAGVFDVSHMAPILLTLNKRKIGGPEDITKFLNYLACRDISGLKNGQVQYNALLNHRGGIIDDITIFKLKKDRFMLVANASNRGAVIKHLKRLRSMMNSPCQIVPVKDHILIALQGPGSKAILTKAGQFADSLEDLFYYECVLLDESLEYFSSILSRTGYTGEDGFEILLPKKQGIALWKRLLEHGASPCGLASRDILRMEMFYPLFGNELNDRKTPDECGLNWLVDDKKKFLGKTRLLAVRNTQHGQTFGFQVLDGGIPRKKYEIILNRRIAGYVTSGSFSFQWNKGLGIAYIKPDSSTPVSELIKSEQFYVNIRGSLRKIKFFLKSPYKGTILRRQK